MPTSRYTNAVIIADGIYPTHPAALEVLEAATFVVCCDGAANSYTASGKTPDIIIGDGDSLLPEVKERFCDRIIYDADQQTNDLTKAVKYLINRFGTALHINIIGATGQREDHTLANIALTTEYSRMGVKVQIVSDYGRFIPCCGTTTFSCEVGAQVSIFNISGSEFRSHSLAYPIYDFTAWWQGTLNEATAESFTIEAKGEYIVYITHQRK